MEEVIRKLEEGTNPEELEDRMGDFMGDENDAGTEEKDGEESMQSRLKKLLTKTPRVDPQLYEFPVIILINRIGHFESNNPNLLLQPT